MTVARPEDFPVGQRSKIQRPGREGFRFSVILSAAKNLVRFTC
jgi:hypothetical protein